MESTWESKCKQCGRCCYHKVYYIHEDVYEFYPDKHCQHLDSLTKRCKVYDRRFTTKADCVKLTPENVKEFKWLPEDCGLK